MVHLTGLWNLLMHCHMSRRYLSVDCQVMGVYREPQSPQKTLVENGELLKVISLRPSLIFVHTNHLRVLVYITLNDEKVKRF